MFFLTILPVRPADASPGWDGRPARRQESRLVGDPRRAEGASRPGEPAADDAPAARGQFPHFIMISTRWMDNDVYGHVNNVVYYAYFDTVINRYLIAEGGLDIAGGPVIGIAAESHCRYRRPITFPTDVDAGLRVGKLGRSSVRYEIGLFPRGEAEVAAEGWFVHVFVDRVTRRPTPIPDGLRAALEKLVSR
jgi:acyl-CoA thioester hydrolase